MLALNQVFRSDLKRGNKKTSLDLCCTTLRLPSINYLIRLYNNRLTYSSSAFSGPFSTVISVSSVSSRRYRGIQVGVPAQLLLIRNGTKWGYNCK